MATLIYVHDPMCSWCWGFAPVWQTVYGTIQQDYQSDELNIRLVAGGLAPDSDKPMPAEMADQIRTHWQKIEQLLGTRFNYDFWAKNIPRRSTYPACRAVIAARELAGADSELAMITAIQQAYYLLAENPSNDDVLLSCAEKTGLNSKRFEQFMKSTECDALLTKEIRFARSIGGNSFPSLFLKSEEGVVELPVDYQNPLVILKSISDLMR